MKILCTDTDDLDNPLHGGQPVRTFAINSRLAKQHQITVLTSSFPGCHEKEKNRSGVQYKRIGRYIPPFGLSPHFTFLASLRSHIKKIPHDLLIEEFTPPIGFCRTPWMTDKPVISMVQWFFFESWEKRFHLPFSKWMKNIASKNRYRYFIVQTDSMARRFRELAPEALVQTIPCGLDEESFSPSPSIDEDPHQNKTGSKDYVLFLGRLDVEHKGLDLLLNAWNKICQQHRIPLVIAGEGEAREYLEKRIKEENLDGLVQLVGKVQGEKKQELLKKCSVFAMSSRFETFGISAAEAMAAGKAVVAFDIENLNEVVSPPWGILIPPFDEEAFGQAIAELWNNPKHSQELGNKAWQEAQRYRWDEIARIQEAFYFEVIEKEKRSR